MTDGENQDVFPFDLIQRYIGGLAEVDDQFSAVWE